mmetsp:Transcript_15968/g.36539  ORF Transcript_15968/g.36539 Transcript_15968/m.36539 type:complete len:137 (+) Transcript_15968:67-477(+)
MPGAPGSSSSTSSSSQPFASTSVLFDKGTVKEAVAALNQRSSITETKSPFGAAQVASKSSAPQPTSDVANEEERDRGSSAAARYGACPEAEAAVTNLDEPFVEHSASAGLYWLLTGKCCHRRREKQGSSASPSQVV